MLEKNATTVEIFGREYKIRGVADEQYMRTVAGYVDKKMREVSSGPSLPSHDRLAILAALNIADELFQERKQASDVQTGIEQKANKLISILDQNLQSGD
jgi:cell division protein ZapA